ncbi:MAG: glycosyltransferase [Anaerolineaceae bacterium]|nr:glycosyltransferase [Anaerolineaceae bacterium]
MKPEVSILLGSYNRLNFLRSAIKSIRLNNISTPYEIIVIDGGSTDGSLKWLIQQKDIITIIQHNHGSFQGKPLQRRSWGYFMNLGFKAAQGKFICMISDDSVLLPDAIMNGIDHIESLRDKGKNVGAGAFYWRNNWPTDENYMVSRTFSEVIFVNHGLYLRSAIEEIGWIEEERYQFYCADIDLCYRLHMAGYEIVDIPDAFLEHYFHASHEARAKISNIQQEDNQTFLAYWKEKDPTISDDRIIFEPLRLKYDDPSKTGYRVFPQNEITKIKMTIFCEKVFRKLQKILKQKG